ncbi:DUF6537 domain-containing protein [Streptomyces plumbiresistens]|uniref:DUF6537 domain-containing protein n=1 Tax=Streptomyces plumbiresistens TaxID=511811 RepID=UPI0031E67ED0
MVRRPRRRSGCDEYRAAIERLLPGLNSATLDAAVELAALPDLVRGYEDIKPANVATYRERLKEVERKLV